MATHFLNEKQWRFEAIDLRAGMAIALWREQRTTAHGLPQEHVPALFFSPPHFQPEPIVNTVVALSACRGTFEPGLYVNEGDTEASFATPDAVGEFLRRAYINGASGDGTDGNEPSPAPPTPGSPSGDNNELPPLPDSQLILALVQRINAFKTAAEQMPQGVSGPFTWYNDTPDRDGHYSGSPPVQVSDSETLTAAAMIMIDEMLRRMPAQPDAEKWLRWYDDLHELSCLLLGLGVAERLLEQPHRDELKRTFLRSLFKNSDISELRQFRLGWLLLFGPAIPLPNSAAELTSLLRHLDSMIDHPVEPWIFPSSITLEDPFETLSRLPLPKSLHWMLPEDVRSNASLYHLLNLMVSEPQAACQKPAMIPLAICLTLFAATCIVAARTGHRNVVPVWLLPIYQSPERSRRAVEQGHAWLIEHLPQAVYCKDYEVLLGRSKTLRYTLPSPPTSPSPAPLPADRNTGLSSGFSA